MKQKKIISLPTNERKIYRQILAFMNFMLGLTPQERDILAEFIKLNNEFEALPPDKRIRFILSTETRKEICATIKMEAKQFNVVLSKMKKKMFRGKLIIDDVMGIHPDLCIKPDEDGFSFEINFVMTNIIPTEVTVNNDIRQFPVTEDEAFIPTSSQTPPVEYKHDASQAEVVEEEDWQIEINNPND